MTIVKGHTGENQPSASASRPANQLAPAPVVSGVTPNCKFVNIELVGLYPGEGATGTQGTLLLENPQGDFQLTSDLVKIQVILTPFQLLWIVVYNFFAISLCGETHIWSRPKICVFSGNSLWIDVYLLCFVTICLSSQSIHYLGLEHQSVLLFMSLYILLLDKKRFFFYMFINLWIWIQKVTQLKLSLRNSGTIPIRRVHVLTCSSHILPMTQAIETYTLDLSNFAQAQSLRMHSKCQ